MLEDFGLMISLAKGIMDFDITLGGFTFSFWEIMLFGMAAGIVLWILWEVFLGD